MLLEDGQVKARFVEDNPDETRISGAEHVLCALGKMGSGSTAAAGGSFSGTGTQKAGEPMAAAAGAGGEQKTSTAK
jgi:hypothetical protein